MSDTHTTVMARVEPDLHALERVHPLVGAAIATGVPTDPAALRELLAVQKEWEANEARKAYTRALAALKRDLPTVLSHDRVVDYTNNAGKRTRYTHTSLAHVMDAVTQPLTQHGFSVSWTPSNSDKLVRVTCRLTHTDGHYEEATLEAPPDTSGNKNPAQAIASTVTLLSRYTALQLLGIATTDMQEPTGEEPRDTGAIDVRRNMRAVAKLVRRGRTKEEAEQFLGKPVAQWTGADIERLAALVEGDQRAPASGSEREDEPEPGSSG